MFKRNNAKKRGARGVAFHILSIIGLIFPFVALCAYYRDKWFVGNQTKIWLGLIVGLIYIILLVSKALSGINKNFKTALSIGVGICISYFLSTIVSDLTLVLISIEAGWIIYLIFDTIAAKDDNYYKNYVEEKAHIEARQEAINEREHLDGSV